MNMSSVDVTDPLPPYLVIDLERDPDATPGHDHVVAVATRDPDGGETRWSGAEVLAAMRGGERFVVAEDGRGGETLLEPATCPACDAVTVVVRDDA
jgi:hypothetical protein